MSTSPVELTGANGFSPHDFDSAKLNPLIATGSESTDASMGGSVTLSFPVKFTRANGFPPMDLGFSKLNPMDLSGLRLNTPKKYLHIDNGDILKSTF